MADVVVPQAPALVQIPGVELVQAGQWNLSTGTVTFTRDDLAAAVAALDCAAVRRPVLKLGHTDPRFDGEPAVGWIDNMALADDGGTVVGDYVGLPGWLGDVIASAYPDRSIEAVWDFRCQIGHTHPFVITAVALLGVSAPGVGTLESLQDVAGLYGVAAAGGGTGGERVAVTVRAASQQEERMPNPRPVQVAASVTTEDVRRKYYADAPWSVWIEELQLDPLQLITMDDETGQRARVPITVGSGDGEDAVSFGEPVPVVIRYEDTPASGAPAKAAARLVFASREESRPGTAPTDPPPTADPAPSGDTKKASGAPAPAEETTNRKGAGMDPVKLREALDLPADAPDTDVAAALATSGLTAATETDDGDDDQATSAAGAPAKATDGVVWVDKANLTALQEQAKKGDQAFKMLQLQDRDRVIEDAIKAGKFPPSRRQHWAMLWDNDPDGTRAQIKQLAAGLVPVSASGYPGSDQDYEAEQTYRRLYPEGQEG